MYTGFALLRRRLHAAFLPISASATGAELAYSKPSVSVKALRLSSRPEAPLRTLVLRGATEIHARFD